MPKEEIHTCCPPPVCINCKEAHNARNRNCRIYKKEQEAVNKANDEFISVGQAKKLLSRTPQYSEVARSGGASSNSTANNANNSHVSKSSSQSVRPKDRNVVNSQIAPNKDQRMNRGSGLSTSQLGISVASEPSSVEASSSHFIGKPRTSSEVLQASQEASQAPTVEGASQSSLPALGDGLINVDIHHPSGDRMDSSSPRRKRSRALASSPPVAGVAPIDTSNRFSALAGVGDLNSKSEHPQKKHHSTLKLDSRDNRTTNTKPSLLRPPVAGKAHSERHPKSQKPSKYK